MPTTSQTAPEHLLVQPLALRGSIFDVGVEARYGSLVLKVRNNAATKINTNTYEYYACVT